MTNAMSALVNNVGHVNEGHELGLLRALSLYLLGYVLLFIYWLNVVHSTRDSKKKLRQLV